MEKSYDMKETKTFFSMYLNAVKKRLNACISKRKQWKTNCTEDNAAAFYVLQNHDESLKVSASLIKFEDCESDELSHIVYRLFSNGKWTVLNGYEGFANVLMALK